MGGCRVFTSWRLVQENGLSRPSEERAGSAGGWEAGDDGGRGRGRERSVRCSPVCLAKPREKMSGRLVSGEKQIQDDGGRRLKGENWRRLVSGGFLSFCREDGELRDGFSGFSRARGVAVGG